MHNFYVNVLFCHLNYSYFRLIFPSFLPYFDSNEWSFEYIKFFLLGMTVMGKENLMILKKRNYRINFKVALDFIFKFTILLKKLIANCLFELFFPPVFKWGSRTGFGSQWSHAGYVETIFIGFAL